MARGLEALGHSVRQVGDRRGLRFGALRRIRYNLTQARSGNPAVANANLVVGFDLDGFLLGRGRPRYVVCLKGVMADELRFEKGWTRTRFRLLSRLEARNARSADVVTVTSDYCRRVATEAYGLDPGRVSVVPEGIDLEEWTETPPGLSSADDRSVTAPATDPLILNVARQYKRKNTIALVRAMPGVRARVPDARLRIVGGGPELHRLRGEVRALGLEGIVELAGELPGHDAMRREYGRASVFCLPSLQEGFGIAYLEAMASGVPVVALDCAAVPEVVPHGEAGFLVPPDDSEALVDALARLLGDAAIRRRMGDAGRRHVQRYAWVEVAQRFLVAAGSPSFCPERPTS